MSNIVRCTEYLKCKGMISKNWCPETDCVHWSPHEYQNECQGAFCETIESDTKCMASTPESVGEVDDELVGLIESAKKLGRELAIMDATAPVLRDASDSMWSMLQDLDAYFDALDWDEAIEGVEAREKAMEEAWERAGVQSEEDAEYG